MNDDSTELSATLRSRLTVDSLWDFALALYARDGVEAACLTLQDEAGADVCELMWHCWLDSHGLVANDAREAPLGEIRDWQAEVTQSIRHLRRRLKPHAQQSKNMATLRGHLKEAELLAEQETLCQLQALSQTPHCVRQRRPDDASLATRLASCLMLYGPAQQAALLTLTTQHTTHLS